jgi:membrane protease subunit HflC
MLQNYKAAVVVAIVALVALMSSIVIVPETHQGVVIFTGKPVRVFNQFKPDVPYGQTGAGIQFRIPFAEQVRMVDRRVLAVQRSTASAG